MITLTEHHVFPLLLDKMPGEDRDKPAKANRLAIKMAVEAASDDGLRVLQVVDTWREIKPTDEGPMPGTKVLLLVEELD